MEDKLHKAAVQGYYNVVRLLIQKGEKCTENTIAEAAGNGHFDIVSILVHSGNKFDHTAVDRALRSGHDRVVYYLISKGGTWSNKGIEDVSRCGHISALGVLMKFELDYPLILKNAARYGHENIINLLIDEKKINFDVTEAVEEAIDSDNLHIAEILLTYQIDFKLHH